LRETTEETETDVAAAIVEAERADERETTVVRVTAEQPLRAGIILVGKPFGCTGVIPLRMMEVA